MKISTLKGLLLALAALVLTSRPSLAANTLLWNTNLQQVSADLQSEDLLQILQQVSAATGWHVYVERQAMHPVSAKFKNLPPGQALRLLVGDLNFALVPVTNARPRLYVFRTDRESANQLLESSARSLREQPAGTNAIPNELIVRLKKGASIDELARKLGAKVIGRIDSLSAYRLQFDDADATETARTDLSAYPEVDSVENNYPISLPDALPLNAMANATLPHIQVTPPAGGNKLLVGVIDTQYQSLGGEWDKLVTSMSLNGTSSSADPASPTHATSMVETLLGSYVNSTGKNDASFGILSVNVFGDNASTSSFDVAQGIAKAVNAGARLINLSLGSESDSPVLHDVIKDASANNVIFIASAGNSPVTSDVYPAAYSEVNAVTAVNNGQIASYANRGDFVSLAAPGDSYVAYKNGTWLVQGTSPAAAYITGIALGYVEANSKATQEGVHTYLTKNYGFKPSSSN